MKEGERKREGEREKVLNYPSLCCGMREGKWYLTYVHVQIKRRTINIRTTAFI